MDEEQQIEQVKISLYGQCPKHKGHTAESCATALFIGMLAGSFLSALAFTFTAPDREAEAIKLGYAQHNAITGKWEWRK